MSATFTSSCQMDINMHIPEERCKSEKNVCKAATAELKKTATVEFICYCKFSTIQDSDPTWAVAWGTSS